MLVPEILTKFGLEERLLAKSIQERGQGVNISPEMSAGAVKALAKLNRQLIMSLRTGITDDNKFRRETTDHFFSHGSIKKILDRKDDAAIENLKKKLASFQEIVRDTQTYLQMTI